MSYPQQPQYPGQLPYPQGAYPQQPAGQPNPFADAQNPYSAPQMGGYAQPVPQPGQLPPFAGLWRQGHVLVMHKNAPLPEICLKSNQPATQRLRRNLQWHHPAIALTILAGVLVYIILAMILTKRATIHVPLTDEWHGRRKQRMLIAWGLGLAAIALMGAGIVLLAQTEEGVYAMLLLGGLFLGIGALIYGQYACSLVRPRRMTDEYIWLVGVHPDYLNRLEAWPYNI